MCCTEVYPNSLFVRPKTDVDLSNTELNKDHSCCLPVNISNSFGTDWRAFICSFIRRILSLVLGRKVNDVCIENDGLLLKLNGCSDCVGCDIGLLVPTIKGCYGFSEECKLFVVVLFLINGYSLLVD